MKKKVIKIPIFFGRFTMIKTNDFKSIADKYKLLLTEDYEAFTFRKIYKDYTNYFIVVSDKCNDSVIVHESVHIANMILFDIHSIPDYNDDEVQAYLTEYIFDETKKFLK